MHTVNTLGSHLPDCNISWSQLYDSTASWLGTKVFSMRARAAGRKSDTLTLNVHIIKFRINGFLTGIDRNPVELYSKSIWSCSIRCVLAIRSVLKLIFVDTLLGPHIHHFMRLLFILNDQLINVKCGSINCGPAIAAHADNFMFFLGAKRKIVSNLQQQREQMNAKKWNFLLLYLNKYEKGGNRLEIEHKIEVEFQERVREKESKVLRIWCKYIHSFYDCWWGTYSLFLYRLESASSNCNGYFRSIQNNFIDQIQCLCECMSLLLLSRCLFIAAAAAVVAFLFFVRFKSIYFLYQFTKYGVWWRAREWAGQASSDLILSVDGVRHCVYLCDFFYLSCSFLNSNVSSCQFYWWIKAFCFCLHMECERLNRCVSAHFHHIFYVGGIHWIVSCWWWCLI